MMAVGARLCAERQTDYDKGANFSHYKSSCGQGNAETTNPLRGSA